MFDKGQLRPAESTGNKSSALPILEMRRVHLLAPGSIAAHGELRQAVSEHEM
jgi:hypothetical protein